MNKNIQGDFQICISVPLKSTENKVVIIIRLITIFGKNKFNRIFAQLIGSEKRSMLSLYSKRSFPLKISSVNVTKSFGHIY